MFYARSPNAQGVRETVPDHLCHVRTYATQWAEPCGLAQAANLAGGFHDAGKQTPLFQQVLQGQAHRVDHATPSATAFMLYANQRKWPRAASSMIANAIYAHHSMLDETACHADIRDCIAGKSHTRTEHSFATYGKASLSTLLAQLSLSTWADRISLPDAPACTQGSAMLRTRMLLSCLVDADYTTAAMHENANYLTESTTTLDIQATQQALATYRATIQQSATADPALCALRNHVFERCTQAGRAQTGLFTLTAPTGTGKTLAMLSFALEQMQQGKDRTIFVLPFLSLTDQSAHIYSQMIPNLLEDHSQAEYTEQTRLFADRWSAPMIVTTSVKFFESLFQAKASRCRHLHHIANSVIVFDESQTLPHELLDATLEVIQLLCTEYHCTVLFSTATQPAFGYRKHITWQPQEIMDDPQKWFTQSQRVQVDWRLAAPTPLETIAEQMLQTPQACVIVNRKDHARTLYQHLSATSDAVFYLTTDLCPMHRTAILQAVTARLQAGLPCYVVATQCIEAGVNLSFPVLYRALAPLESIIQAAGRCNRNGMDASGHMVVFIPNADKLYPDDFYAYAANKVLLLHNRQPIALHDLTHIDAYYRELYTDANGCADKKALRDAIQAQDYPKVAQEYRLIPQSTVQVIVPYQHPDALARYTQLTDKNEVQGLRPADLRQAAPLAVSVWDRDWVRNNCIPVYFSARGQRIASDSWYILQQPHLYDSDKRGLLLDTPASAIY